MIEQQRDLYVDCIRKQLDEVDMLSAIYCAPGEMHIFDASVISDFNEFLANGSADPASALRAHLDYTISVALPISANSRAKLDVRIELPHLYPALENAIVITHSPLLSKAQELHFRERIATHIASCAAESDSETYVFQALAWIQEQIEQLLKDGSDTAAPTIAPPPSPPTTNVAAVERLWIYSHHIKSKTKRQEIVRQSRSLELSGFSRPGKPGIICVEGLQERTQEFWRILRAMRWQKISICKSEAARKEAEKLDKWRRFDGFKEQLFCAGEDDGDDEGPMDMGQFLKYLEAHNSGYMKQELFGLA